MLVGTMGVSTIWFESGTRIDVVAVALDCVQDVLVVLRPQAMYHFVGGLEAVPIHARDAHYVTT